MAYEVPARFYARLRSLLTRSRGFDLGKIEVFSPEIACQGEASVRML
jgi:hypothetical protein